VAQQNMKALNTLERLGATIVPVSIPHLQVLQMAHSATISAEMSQALEYHYIHQTPSLELSDTIQIAIGMSMTAVDYVAAARMKGWGLKYFKSLYSQVDLFITPTTSMVAPEIPAHILAEGMSDTALVIKIMKFVFLANFLGFPSMSVPVGYSTLNNMTLPIGMLLNAAHWNDALLLRIAHALEVHHLNRTAPI